MDVGKMLVGAGLGAGENYFANNVKQAQAATEGEKLALEQKRRVQLLQQKEAITAGYQKELQQMKGDQDIGLQKQKASDDIALAKVENEGKTKNGGFTPQQITKMQIDMGKEYQSYVAGEKEAAQEPMPESEWIENRLANYPNVAKTLGFGKSDNGSSDSVESKISEFAKTFSRVKGKGGPPEKTTALPSFDDSSNSGTVVQPMPLSESRINEDAEKTEVQTIKADKAKNIPAKVQEKVKEAERMITAAGKNRGDSNLRRIIGKIAAGAGEFTAKEWNKFSAQLEKRMEELRKDK